MSSPITYEKWSGKLRRSCGHYYSRRGHKEGQIWGHFHLRDRMGLDMADIACDIERVERTRRGIRQDGAEHMFLLFQISGRTALHHHGEATCLSPGEFTLIDSTAPAELRYGNSRTHFLSLHLPRADFLAGAETLLSVGHKRGAAHPIAAALRTSLMCWDTDAGQAEQEELQAEFLYALVRLAFADRAHSRTVKTGQRRWELIEQTLDRHICDPELDLAGLAALVGLSPRQLQRDLASEGATFSRLLREKRLSLMAERLRLARARGAVSISALAYDCGFGDLSNFNRQFRCRFGFTPGEFLRKTC